MTHGRHKPPELSPDGRRALGVLVNAPDPLTAGEIASKMTVARLPIPSNTPGQLLHPTMMSLHRRGYARRIAGRVPLWEATPAGRDAWTALQPQGLER